MPNNKIQIPILSKSRFMAGIQCHKRLYLECYHRDFADEIDANQQAIFDSGTDVGVLARKIYPGGSLIEADFMHFPEGLTVTREALAKKKRVPLYEAAFQYDDVRTRVDILKPEPGGTWSLIEVKSSTSLKPEYVLDAAIQYYVVNGTGLEVASVCLAYLNKEYIYAGGEYDVEQLFVVEDITEQVVELQPEIEELLKSMRLCLAESEVPEISAGKHCSKPYTCNFYGYCHKDELEHHISQLPRISEKLLLELEAAGIYDIHGIPADFSGLNGTQQRVRDCVVNGNIYMDKGIQKELKALVYPVHFLDFETFKPALPLYLGTHPHEVIPFQWSAHVLDKNGELAHWEFLHDGTGDPRLAFVKTLIGTIGKTGSVVVYSVYEESRIKALAATFPQFADELLAIIPRLFDLLPLIRNYCYHPEFHGHFGLKDVLPALVPEMGYKDLEIQEGGVASLAYTEIINPQTTPARRNALRTNLLKYCERDTEAMVRLVEVLRI